MSYAACGLEFLDSTSPGITKIEITIEKNNPGLVFSMLKGDMVEICDMPPKN